MDWAKADSFSGQMDSNKGQDRVAHSFGKSSLSIPHTNTSDVLQRDVEGAQSLLLQADLADTRPTSENWR